MSIKPLLLTLLSMISLAGRDNRSNQNTKETAQSQTQERVPCAAVAHILNRDDEPLDWHDKKPTITIWVHGTRRASMFFFPNFFRSIQDMCHASAYNKKNNLLTIAQTLSESDPENFPFKDIYCFGWSGRLKARARFKAAQDLYAGILELIDAYKQKYGVTPHIRLITHSHGGNVALYLAEVQKNKAIKIIIDELVLLACPVQQKTIAFIKDDMFKQAFSFYSNADIIQVLDPQGLTSFSCPFFSERKFPEQENLQQIPVELGGHSIGHLRFVYGWLFWEPFVKHLPQELAENRCIPEEGILAKIGNFFISLREKIGQLLFRA